jgi:hypothetical protein
MNNFRKRMYGIYWNVRRIVTPGLKFSEEIYEKVLRGRLDEDTIWLDLGRVEQSKTESKLATA